MTSAFIRRRTSLTVGRRLFLGLLPALLAVVLTVELAYYGEYGRSVPNTVLVGAGILAVASLAVTWINTRYLSARITRLTAAMPQSADAERGEADEFDRIERGVDHLGTALSVAEAKRVRADVAAAARLRDEATMLAAVTHDTIAQLDQVRLPLHILLETRFGDLNENQEELLRDAQSAADAMGAALRRLAQIADADRDALPVQRELVPVNDVVRGVLPLARAAAERNDARVETSLEPGLPRVMADRARLAEALTMLASEAATETTPDRPLVVATAREPGGAGVSITISPSPTSVDAGVLLARRLIVAQGGSAEEGPGGVVVRLGG